jgi:hypothetical protein
MFIGHFGLSFAVKKPAPKISLVVLFVATQFVDILWPVMLLLGIERVDIVPGHTAMNAFDFVHYPYTHSLLMGIVWGVVLGSIYWLIKRDVRNAVIVGLCVLSHWFFDLVVHVADLPLTPFTDGKYGWGLWNHLVPTLILEGIIFFGGVYLYLKSTRAITKAGRWNVWLLVGILVLMNISNLVSPPPAADALVSMVVSFLIVFAILLALAYWVDKSREQLELKKVNNQMRN